MRPTNALVLYGNDPNENIGDYITIHRIEEGIMLEGKPITKRVLRKLFSKIFSEDKKEVRKEKEEKMLFGKIPSNLLYFDPNSGKITWWHPPQVRHLWFSEGKDIKSGKYPLPGLVFTYKNGLSVVAYKGKEYDEKKELFRAPFWNSGEHGSVCMGTARTKLSKDFNLRIKQIEELFFDSYFSHSMGGNPTKTDYVELMNELINTEKFPEKELIEIK